MSEGIASGTTIITSMSCCNAPEAIKWLCLVFGFEKRAVCPGPRNTIMHAELNPGSGMLMLGSLKDDEHSRLRSNRTKLAELKPEAPI